MQALPAMDNASAPRKRGIYILALIVARGCRGFSSILSCGSNCERECREVHACSSMGRSSLPTFMRGMWISPRCRSHYHAGFAAMSCRPSGVKGRCCPSLHTAMACLDTGAKLTQVQRRAISLSRKLSILLWVCSDAWARRDRGSKRCRQGAMWQRGQ